jgi:hypothetical protein
MITQASAGLLADTRALLNRARLEAENYKSSYQTDISVKVMADRISQFAQMYTLYGSVRYVRLAPRCSRVLNPSLFVLSDLLELLLCWEELTLKDHSST